MNIKLGMEIKDEITGFKGVVTGLVDYISGCNQALITPPIEKKTGKIQESQWLDVQRLKQIGKRVIKLDNAETPGCDAPAPKR